MNRDTTVTLDQVHDGILAAVRAKFPALQTVEAYLQDRKGMQVPAFLLELSELESDPDADPGTEQLAVQATFEARLVLGFRQDAGKNPKLEIRRLAAAVAAFVRLQRWGCPIGPAEVIGAFPDDFEPELDQYEVWRVEWRQVLHLGESVWNDAGAIPQPYLGFSPLIGPPYVDLYVPVAELPDGAP